MTGPITWLKVKAFQGLAWLDRQSDPFDEFTRPAVLKYMETRTQKAAKFEADLVQHFFMPGPSVFNYCIPQDNRLAPYLLGDQALHHGLVTAMWALKYNVTHDSADLEWLRKCVAGLEVQQPNGVLIRGVAPDGGIQQDASYDQASGHLAGLFFSAKCANIECGRQPLILAGEWARRIIQDGYKLTNIDGTKTKYGDLLNGPLTEPSSLTLTLAILLLGGRPQEYRELRDKYREMIPYAYTRMSSLIGKYYDLHRAAIHLHILQGMDPQPEYAAGLDRIARMTRKSGNIWVQYLTNHIDLPMCQKVLLEFTLEDKQYDTLKINVSPYGRTVWDGQWCSLQPLPAWQKSGVDCWWTRNPYTMDGGYELPSSRYHLGDWLLAYWALVGTGVI